MAFYSSLEMKLSCGRQLYGICINLTIIKIWLQSYKILDTWHEELSMYYFCWRSKFSAALNIGVLLTVKCSLTIHTARTVALPILLAFRVSVLLCYDATSLVAVSRHFKTKYWSHLRGSKRPGLIFIRTLKTTTTTWRESLVPITR